MRLQERICVLGSFGGIDLAVRVPLTSQMAEPLARVTMGCPQLDADTQPLAGGGPMKFECGRDKRRKTYLRTGHITVVSNGLRSWNALTGTCDTARFIRPSTSRPVVLRRMPKLQMLCHRTAYNLVTYAPI